MKAYFTVSCMLALSTVFANPGQQDEINLISNEIAPVFQRYLAKCRKHNMINQPVHLRNASREKSLSSGDITLLNLDLPSTMQINAIAEYVLYGDADVVHLKNTSTTTASHLYELLQNNYSHFIHVPSQEKGFFIASKYPLSQAGITRIEKDKVLSEDLLEFVIHDENYRARVGSNDLSIEVGNPNQNTTMSVLLGEVPGTFTAIKQAKQQFSLSQLAERTDLLAGETFEIIPVRRGGGGGDKDNDDRGGGYYGGKVGMDIGPGGAEWNASFYAGYEDNRGNFAEAEVRRNESGRTSATVEAGHEKEK